MPDFFQNIFLQIERISETVILFFQYELIFSLAIFIPILLLTSLLKKRFPYLQYGLWILVFIRLILPTDLQSAFSLQTLANEIPAIHSLSQFLFQESLESGAHLAFSVDASELDNTFAGHEGIISDSYLLDTSNTFLSFSWQSILFLSWLGGFLLFAGILCRRILKFRALARSAAMVETPALTEMVDRWRDRFTVTRPVRLITSENFLSPFTSGIFKPVIYLPDVLLQNGDQQTLETVIAHEMAHIKRFDFIWIRLQNIIQLVYFFHPVAWFANGQINLARERICDHLVLETGRISPAQYGRSMITMLRMNLLGVDGVGFLPTFGNQRHQFKQRIIEINGGRIMKRQRQWLAAVITLILGCLLLPMSCEQNDVNTPGSEAESAVPGSAQLMADEGKAMLSPLKAGKITAEYGNNYLAKTDETKFHRGIDIAAETGSKIAAIADGIVLFAGDDGGYGNRITLQHDDGLKSVYAHMDTCLVSKGAEVAAGDLIGLVGSSGMSTAPHLHFEIRKNGKTQDPENFIDFSALFKKKDQ